MSTVLGLKRYLRPVVLAGEGAYLFGEHGVTALRGRYAEALVPLLDGTRSRAEVVSEAPGGAPAEQVSGLLARLDAADLVAEYPPEVVDPGDVAYWEAAGMEGAAAAERVARARVRLVMLGSIDPALAREACHSAGLAVAGDAAGNADLSVVLCDDYLNAALPEIDRAHRAAGRAWLLAKPTGTTVWIGPVFEPGDGPCWACLAHRLWANRWAEAQVQRARGETGPAPRPEVRVAASVTVGLQVALLHAAHWVAGHRTEERRDILTLDTLTMASARHRLRRRPQCEECGDPALQRDSAWRPPRLVSRPKTAGGGGHAEPPLRVYERYRHLISPITGLVTAIRRDPRAPEPLHSYVASESPTRPAHRPGAMAPSPPGVNGGKGVTALDAEVSALCEALERRSGTFQGDETMVVASYADVRDRAVHPDECQLYHPRQFADRAEWNRAGSPAGYVCAPLDESVPIAWTPVWSLTHDTHRLLPTGLLYYGTPTELSRGFVRADSNGSAAGGSLEDALVQGFLELVERDAVALWWYNRTRQPAVDVTAFRDHWADRIREVYAELGRELWVLDVTSDLGVPAMAAISRRTGAGPEDITFGFGAHFDPGVALRRALTEMNQLLPAVLGSGGPGEHGTRDPGALRWWREATVASHPCLLPDRARPATMPGDHAWPRRPDLLDDVTAIRDLVAARGMELLMLDQTRPDIELPVVKVIVPGMRQIWPRFAPGRLYDVPVRLGRLAAPTAYEDLNDPPPFV
jgi:ribosomal protein S12 methylthiotransferase accessory factor